MELYLNTIKNEKMKKLFTLLLITITFISYAQEEALLRLKYKKGEKYVMKMNMSQNMGGGTMLMNMDMYMKIEVKDVTDDVYDTEMSFTRMAMDMKQGAMDIKFDTDTKDEDLDAQGKMMKTQMAPMLDMLIGAKFNSLGKVIEMKVLEGVGNTDEFQNANNSVTYPEEPVKVGTTWSEEKDNKGMKMKYTYKVESIASDQVVLGVTGDITGTATGAFTGTMNIDRANGLPSDSTIDMNMELMGQQVTSKVSFDFKKM